MWKGRPVISGDTGGIAVQLIHGYTGYAVNSPAGVAFYIKRLLNEPQRIDAIGHQAKEFVRNRFLLTRHVQDYLGIMIHLARGTA
jgi:trehalose synthase